MPISSPTATTPRPALALHLLWRVRRAARGLGRVLRAPFGRKVLWLGALSLVALLRVGLWLAPLRKLQALVARLGRGQFSEPLSKQDMAVPDEAAGPARFSSEEHELAWAVRHMARLVPAASCLTQALALQVLLGRRGLGSRLCIGVRKVGGRGFEAHAWVERAGRVIIGGQPQARQDEHWTPLTAWDFTPAPSGDSMATVSSEEVSASL